MVGQRVVGTSSAVSEPPAPTKDSRGRIAHGEWVTFAAFADWNTAFPFSCCGYRAFRCFLLGTCRFAVISWPQRVLSTPPALSSNPIQAGRATRHDSRSSHLAVRPIADGASLMGLRELTTGTSPTGRYGAMRASISQLQVSCLPEANCGGYSLGSSEGHVSGTPQCRNPILLLSH